MQKNEILTVEEFKCLLSTLTDDQLDEVKRLVDKLLAEQE